MSFNSPALIWISFRSSRFYLVTRLNAKSEVGTVIDLLK